MVDALRTIDQIKKDVALRALDQTIQYARIRCLSEAEIIERIATLDQVDESSTYVHRLFELELGDSDLERLVDAMDILAQRSETASPKVRAKADRNLLRLVRLLPSDLANRFAEAYVDHRLKARRQWAYFALRNKVVSYQIAVKLIKVFRETGDQESLQLIARNPALIPDIGADFILENLDDEYWRARVIEALITYDRETALLLSHQYPFEFAHATGRTGDKSLLGPLGKLLEQNRDDLEFISIYAYALGKLQGRDQLQSLQEFVLSAYST